MVARAYQVVPDVLTIMYTVQDYNQSLSERRAQSILKNLEARGIDASRMRTEAYGETRPIDDNSTAEGRSRNRRVEVNAL